MTYFTKEKLRHNNIGFFLELMVLRLDITLTKNMEINRQQPTISEIVTILKTLGYSFAIC